MPSRYKYKALGSDGVAHTGLMTAESDEQVLEYLSSRELVPIKIQVSKPSAGSSLLGFFRGVDYENLILFTNNLATMYRAGIPIMRALTLIKIGPEKGRFHQAVQQIRFSIQSGKSLSEAMAEFDDIFTKVYRNSIAAGEESGKLEEILDELSSMLEQEMELSRLIKSGLRYPIIVMSVIAIAIVVLMVFVVPSFVSFYSSFGADLPLPTKILIATSNFFTSYWMYMLAALIAGGYGFHRMMKSKAGRLFVDRNLLKMPIFGELMIKGNTARFALMFRILFKAGMPIIQSLNILSDSVKNSMMSLEIKKLEEVFRRGSDLGLVQEEFKFLPDMAKQMISIGLESGALDRMLHEVGQYYSKEVQYTSRHLTAILEPLLTMVISGLVLVLALAIFLPMWSLIKVFKGG